MSVKLLSDSSDVSMGGVYNQLNKRTNTSFNLCQYQKQPSARSFMRSRKPGCRGYTTHDLEGLELLQDGIDALPPLGDGGDFVGGSLQEQTTAVQ